MDFLSFRQQNDKKWATISGEVVLIKHMSTEHIIHSMRLLVRNDQQTTKAYHGLKAELDLRRSKKRVVNKISLVTKALCKKKASNILTNHANRI